MLLRNPTAAARYAVPLTFTLPVLLACAVPDAPLTAANEHSTAEDQPLEGPGEGQPPGPPPGPRSCAAEEDCSDACPPDAKGCTCHQPPHGAKICVPTCADDGDCPSLPHGPPLKCITAEGICAPPQPPPPPPKPCSTTADCVDACPPGAKGCTCHVTPHDEKLCVPTCDADADCPAPPHGPPMTCLEGGICAPPHPPPPPEG